VLVLEKNSLIGGRCAMLIGLFVALLLLLFGGAPVLLGIGIAGLLGMLLTPGVVLAIFPQKMFAMLDSFSLLAMPFFILAGEIMNRSGITTGHTISASFALDTFTISVSADPTEAAQ
jgi:TRAP-type mannitol/chloroaromatic compound transport system permease large subunit